MRAGFAVIAFRTSSVLPGGTSRILEIAVEQLDGHGRAEDSWSALLGATNRNGGPGETDAGTTFAEVMPTLFDLLRGRVLVAHNAGASVLFLETELERAGLRLPERPRVLSTMRFARLFSPTSGRSLASCCGAAGITDVQLNEDADEPAAAVASATAALARRYGSEALLAEAWGTSVASVDVFPWPVPVPHGQAGGTPAVSRPFRPSSAPVFSVGSDPGNFLHSTAQRLSAYVGPAAHLDYLALVDDCLTAGEIHPPAATALAATAESLGISHFVSETLHREYFADLVHIARAARELDTSHLVPLVAVGHLLDLPASVIAETIAAANAEVHSGQKQTLSGPGGNWALHQLGSDPAVASSSPTDQDGAIRLPPRHLAPRAGGIVF